MFCFGFFLGGGVNIRKYNDGESILIARMFF